MVHRYWLVPKIYRSLDQTGNVSCMKLTPFVYIENLLNFGFY